MDVEMIAPLGLTPPPPREVPATERAQETETAEAELPPLASDQGNAVDETA